MLFRVAIALAVLSCCLAGQDPQTAPPPDSKAALVVEWRNAPALDGNRLRGSLVIINQSDDDFDQTVVIEAVNDIGKAFTLGYQHFTLRNHTRSATIRFDTALPTGHYSVRADAVAEVARRNQIHRTALKASTDFTVTSPL